MEREKREKNKEQTRYSQSPRKQSHLALQWPSVPRLSQGPSNRSCPSRHSPTVQERQSFQRLVLLKGKILYNAEQRKKSFKKKIHSYALTI